MNKNIIRMVFASVFLISISLVGVSVNKVNAAELKGASLIQAGKYLFVANRDAGKIYVFNNDGKAKLNKIIELGSAPSSMVIYKDYLLVALSQTKKIKSININTLALAGDIDAPKMPYWLAIDGDVLHSTVSRSNGADFYPFSILINSSNNTVLASTTVGWPTTYPNFYMNGNEHIIINPKTHVAYLGNIGYSPDNIKKFDISDRNNVKYVMQNSHGSLGSNGQQFVFDIDTEKIYFAAGGSEGYAVQVVNPNDLTKEASLSLGAYPNSVAGDAAYIYGGRAAYSEKDDIKVYDRNSKILVKSYTLPDEGDLLARGISVGDYLYAVSGKYLYSLGRSNSDVVRLYDFINEKSFILPDLTVTALVISSPDPTSPSLTNLNLDFCLKNIGLNTYSENTKIKFINNTTGKEIVGTVKDFDSVSYSTENIPRISPVQSWCGIFNIKKDGAIKNGVLKDNALNEISLTIDPDNTISELDETNNELKKNITIGETQPVDKPDLELSDLQVAREGGVNYLKFIFKNNGVATKEGQIVSLKALDKTTGDIYTSGFPNSFTGSKEALSSSALLTKNPALYNFTVTIDYLLLIDESNENNNVFEKTITLGSNDDKWYNIPGKYYQYNNPGTTQARFVGTCNQVCGDIGKTASPQCVGWYDSPTYCRKTGTATELMSAGNACDESEMISDVGLDYCCCVDSSPADGINISNVNVQKISDTSAKITWETDVLSNTWVMYGETLEYGQAVQVDDEVSVKYHNAYISSLKADKKYYYKLSSRNESTNKRAEKTGEFSTAVDVINFSKINVPTSLIRPNKVTINWNTDVPTNSEVHYWSVDKTQENWNWDLIDNYSLISHGVELKDLKPFTTYKFTVSGQKTKGAFKSTSDEFTFTTTIDSKQTGGTDDNYNKNANLLKNERFDEILTELKQLRDLVKEQNAKIKYLEKLTSDLKEVSEAMQTAINNFITYGVDPNTQKLGEGERAAVIFSYKAAFSKLPETEAELADAIKIASGRWPSTTNDKAEKKAKNQFAKIYKRIPDMNNANDNAAVTVMAYGLRQKAENRNLNSEKSGIKTFKEIYGHNPSTTEDWNIMQAITYSGSSRGVDSDGDLLTDDREKALGTDPKKKDTDGDGFMDGEEVANGYDPLKK